MKKLAIIILSLLCLFPSFVFADAGGAGAAGECQNFNCHCTWPYPEATGGGRIIGSYKLDIPGLQTEDECQAACIVESGVSPQDEGSVTATLTCLDAPLSSDQASQQDETKDTLYPRLNIPLPGLGYKEVDDGYFGTPIWENVKTSSNLLGSYVSAAYEYLLVAASLVAVTMLMIGGLQYATARGDSKQVDSAKKRISNAVIGVILLLLAYNIAFIINPATTTFQSLAIKNVAAIQMDKSLSGLEGSATIFGGTGTWENLSEPYKGIVARAKTEGVCKLPEGLASPTGTLPNQGTHHWSDGGTGTSYNFKDVDSLDWATTWDAEIYAPYGGVVTYVNGAEGKLNKCGNQIRLKSPDGTSITICHAKDFLNSDGEYAPGQVQQGDVIGHSGGRCCLGGGTPPKGWVTTCNVSGTPCTDPKTGGSCECQPLAQSGNTTGPHVHITLNSGSSNILSCLK